ncbi:TPA: hypothetical protein N0F65_004689, partial [Lagenidium giganteum]
DVVRSLDLEPSTIFSCDQSGFDAQDGVPNRVIAKLGAPDVLTNRGSYRENTSLRFCCKAIGVIVSPMYVLVGKRVNSTWLTDAPDGSGVVVTDNAFVDEHAFLKWIGHFAKFLNDRPALLLLDNISAQITIDVRRHLLAFPPHTTHCLQPLDAGVFRAMKANWRKLIQQNARETYAQHLTKHDRIKMRKLTVETMVKSWKSTGFGRIIRQCGTSRSARKPGLQR